MPVLTEEEEARIEALLRQGLAYHHIAEQTGRAIGTISDVAHRRGLGRKRGPDKAETPAPLAIRVLELRASGLTPAEIGFVLGEERGRPLHRQSVSRILKTWEM